MTTKIFFLSLILFLAGCSSTSSSNIKTSGLYTSYTVTPGDSSTVQCQAIFQVGGSLGTYVILDSGDNVTCNGHTMSYTQDILGQIIYNASVPTASNGTYTLALSRSGEGTYNSSVTMVPTFQITSPTNGANIKKGSVLTATWTADTTRTASMNVSLRFQATTNTGTVSGGGFMQSYPETGKSQFPASDTQLSPAVSGTLSGTLTFSRTLVGTMDPALAGNIYSGQTQTLNVNLVD